MDYEDLTEENFNQLIPKALINSKWGKQSATWKQKRLLNSLGLQSKREMTRGEAFLLINVLLKE